MERSGDGRSKADKMYDMARGGSEAEKATALRWLRRHGYDAPAPPARDLNSQAVVPYSGKPNALDIVTTAGMAIPNPYIQGASMAYKFIRNNWGIIKPIAKTVGGWVGKGVSKLWNWIKGKFTKKDKPKPLPAPNKVEPLPPAVAPDRPVIMDQTLNDVETDSVNQATEYPNSFANYIQRVPDRSYESALPFRSSLYTTARRRMGSNAAVFNTFVSPGSRRLSPFRNMRKYTRRY